MPKSPLEKQLEKNRLEAKRQAERNRKDEQKRLRQEQIQARQEALRQQASTIINCQETIDGFRILDATAELFLKCLLEHCGDTETGYVSFNNDLFPVQFRNSIALELEKLTQYGMIGGLNRWISGSELNLLPTAFSYFERKGVAMQKKAVDVGSSVENHFHGNANVITAPVSSSTIVAGNNNHISNNEKANTPKSSKNCISDSMIINKVFLSHRSVDKSIADMLLDFFVGVGVPREAVFCSSLPGNDINEKISSEVKEALNSSTVNIALLSKDYYESAFCLNEAGIMWFLDETIVVPIALPEITPDNMYGFLNGEYKLRRLDNADDIAYIYDTVSDKLSLPRERFATLSTETGKLIMKYKDFINTRGTNH